MMFKKLLLSLLVTVPVVAQAEWLELSKSEEFIYYIDPDRTVATVDSLKYGETWLKMVVHTDLTKDGLGIGDHKLVKYKVKCNSNEISYAGLYAYKKGKLIDSYIPRYDEYDPVVPESRGELIAFVVCRYLYGEE